MFRSAYLFMIIKYFSFAFFLFIPFATQFFSTLVMSPNLRNQAPLFTELRILQETLILIILHSCHNQCARKTIRDSLPQHLQNQKKTFQIHAQAALDISAI